MRVEAIAPNAWALFDADDRPSGCVVLDAANGWEFRDPNNRSFIPPRVLVLAPALQDLGHDWLTNQRMRELAAKLLRDAGEVVRLYLPWAPNIIRTAYREKGDEQARLAWLFSLVAAQNDDPALAPVGCALERQAYEALTDLYAVEPELSKRTPALRDALKAAFRSWQGTIANPDRAWLFNSKAQSEAEIRTLVSDTKNEDGNIVQADEQREMAMLALVADAGSRRLHRLFRESADGRETVRRLIERWYLPRYDLVTADQLKAAAEDAMRDPGHGGALDARQSVWLRLAPWSQRLTGIAALVYFMAAVSVVWSRIGLGVSESGSRWAMLAIYTLCGAPPLLAWLTAGRPDTSAPRLLAGILVGLLGTVIQQEWGALADFAQAKPWAAALLGVGFLGAAYRVLLVKIRQVIGNEGDPTTGKREVRWDAQEHMRCRMLWARGLALAFLVALVLTDLLGDFYITDGCSAQANTTFVMQCLPGLVGHTYPALVAVFTPLLLFAGVFTQLLWEERPITEGIA
jgi:hypothetical protein